MNIKSIRTLLAAAIVITVNATNVTAAITPNMLSGLKAWYQPSTLSGPTSTPVTSWADSSGNGFNLTASGSTNPTIVSDLGVNKYSGVHFIKSVNDPLTVAGFNNSASSTIFAVAQVLSSSPTYNIWIDGQAARQTVYQYNNEFSMFAGVEQRDVLGGAGGTNDFALHRYLASFDGATSVGGVDGLESGFVNPSNGTIGNLVIGDHTNPGDGNDTTLNLAEVIIYNRALSSSERAQIEQYLFEKFFVPVPEPSSLVLLGLGAIGLAVKTRRRRAAD